MLVDAGYVVVKVDNRSATAISKKLANIIVKAYRRSRDSGFSGRCALAEKTDMGRSRASGRVGLELRRLDDADF